MSKRQTGRPTDYSDALTEKICEALMDGRSLRSICTANDMPHRITVLRWLEKYPAFASKYARAREAQADYLFEEMQDVADSGNADDVQRARLRVLTMQWRASKLAPKKYGDKLDVGMNAEIKVSQVVRKVVDPKS